MTSRPSSSRRPPAPVSSSSSEDGSPVKSRPLRIPKSPATKLKRKLESPSSDAKPRTTAAERPEAVTGWVLPVMGFMVLLVLLVFAFPSLNSPKKSGKDYHKQDVDVDVPAFKVRAEGELLMFRGDLFDGRGASAKVLQIETVKGLEAKVEWVVRKHFDRNVFAVVEQDGEVDREFNVRKVLEVEDDRPVLVLVRNAHRGSDGFLRSFAASMSNSELLSGTQGNKRKSTKKVGFLFLGSSLDSASCASTNLKDHDENVLQWSRTFLSRLTNWATVCG